MKFTFICGSIEPGKDGVGDYTRRLAGHLCTQGHSCQIFAINDCCDTEENPSEGLQLIRRENVLLSSETSQEVFKLIDAWSPDWVSLQFVCFSFHPKGFIHHLIPFISECRSHGRSLQIMFHELWVGEQPTLPFKHKVMGGIQKYIILNALNRWHPEVLHTSNRLYQYVLEQHAYESQILPIYGNIPICEPPVVPIVERAENERILLFPFSQRHDWNVVESMERFADFAREAEVTLKIVQIGHLQSGENHWGYIQEFAKEQNWDCLLLGQQNEATVSHWMQAADIGVSSAHIHLANKSGAAAAMLEHGLPTICTITDPVSKRFEEAPQLDGCFYSFFNDEKILVDLFRNPPARPPQARLPILADEWLQQINDLSDR